MIGTFWLTLQPAWNIARERAFHLCQGYEGAFTAYQPIRGEIDAAYRLPLPKLVVSKHLIPICQQFTEDVTYVGQIVEDEFYRARTPRENDPLRVLLFGQSQADLKGIDEGTARSRTLAGSIRSSTWCASRLGAFTREEPLDSVQEFHVALTTREMTRLMHSCDVLIAPNHREEGFGLPAAEALASGIPAVLTAIPSYQSWDERHDYALFAPEENAVELGERLIELLGDAALRETLRVRGREVAEQWHAEQVADRLEKFFRERK